ncbi:MAG: hypothetical protein ACPLQO_12865 [Desulfotomaculales bacterium]
MGRSFHPAGRPTLVMIGRVPAVGPLFRKKEEAVQEINLLLEKVGTLISNAHLQPYRIVFKRQNDGRYTLAVKARPAAVDILADVDELLFKRFQKAFRGIFILTSFYEGSGKVECLAVTEGLGAVLYGRCGGGFFLKG